MKKLLMPFLLFTVSLLLLSFFIRGVSGNISSNEILKHSNATGPFESSHERAPYVLMLSLLNNKTAALTKELADIAAPDVGYNKGNYFIFFPAGISLYILPFYLIGSIFNVGQLAAYFSSALTSALTVVLISLILRKLKYPTWISMSMGFTYLFATTALSYSITIYQHSATAFLLLASFYSLIQFRSSKKVLAFLWGSALWSSFALSIWVDYPNALLFMPVMIGFALSTLKFQTNGLEEFLDIRLTGVISFVFSLVFLGLLLSYNQTFHGNWKKIAQTFKRYDGKVQIVESASPAAKRGILNRAAIFTEERLPHGISTLLVGEDKGIFIFSPVLLLGLLGLWGIHKKNSMIELVALATIVCNVIMYASFSDPWGGWAFGPRYLIPSMAIFPLFIARWLNSNRLRLIKKIIFTILFVISCSISLSGSLTSNLIPPKVEAVPLNLTYTFLATKPLIFANKSGSYVYNTFFSSWPLINYYLLLLITITLIQIIIVFIFPLFLRHED